MTKKGVPILLSQRFIISESSQFVMRDGGKIYSHQIFPMSPLDSAIWALLLTQKLPRRGKSELFECCYT